MNESTRYTNAQLDRIKMLIQESGYPLEYRMATICMDALQGAMTPLEQRPWQASTSQYIYPGTDKNWREVDQLFNVTYGVGLDDGFFLTLGIDILIECKHRTDVVFIGLKAPDSFAKPAIIAAGPGAYTRLMDECTKRMQPPFPDIPLVSIVNVTVPSSGKENGIKNFDEQLVQNVAGSLYDGVHSLLGTRMEGITESWSRGLKVIYDLPRIGVDIDAINALGQTYTPFDLRVALIRNVNDQAAQRFRDCGATIASSYFSCVVPILCIDMPLLVGTIDQNGTVGELKETSACLVRQRIKKWPGNLKPIVRPYGWSMTNRPVMYPSHRGMKEAMLLVCTVEGLPQILETILKWGQGWQTLLGESTEALQRVRHTFPLEEAIIETFFIQAMKISDQPEIP